MNNNLFSIICAVFRTIAVLILLFGAYSVLGILFVTIFLAGAPLMAMAFINPAILLGSGICLWLSSRKLAGLITADLE